MNHHLASILCRAACACAAALLLVPLASCGGSTALTPDPARQFADVTAPAPSGALLQETPETQARLDAEWAAILADPGTPGVDYDPQSITVSYKPGLRVASALAADQAATALAASGPNAILRENRQYEAVTGAIAQRFGLGIRTQCYVNRLNFAGFSLPDGADRAAILAGIRREFADSIEWATYSRLLYPCYSVNDPDYTDSTTTSGGLWGHKRVRVGEAWDYNRGSASVKIAVVDTGVRITHEELSLRVLNPQTAFPGETCDLANSDNTMEDSDGHGTFIAGLVCGQANNNRTIAGVAFDCEVIPVKISNGGSAGDDILAAGCRLGASLGAKVVNLSWGGYGGHPLLQEMVNNLLEDNVLFVAAAGNDSVTDAHYPSDYTNAVSVGWTGTADQRTGNTSTGGSNYGDGVDICAPGEGLKSSGAASDNDYFWGAGTSFSSPIVAAAAGLLYTADPTLTIAQVRSLLEDTGAPTSGFSTTNPPLRLDIAAALEELASVKVVAPAPEQLIYQGSITVAPDVRGEPDTVEYYVNGALAATAANAPWSATLDLSSIQFGLTTIQIHAIQGADSSDAYLDIIVDNSSGSFPVVEHFDNLQNRSFLAVDVRGYPESVVTALKRLNPMGWDYSDVTTNGPGYWMEVIDNVVSTPYSMYCGLPDSTYGKYETDALISRRINLTNAANPTLVFQTHYNLQDNGARDRGSVLVSEDNGLTWDYAVKQDASDAYWTGYASAWSEARVDLSPYAGKLIHLAFLMESNRNTTGQDPGAAAGWWIDDAVVATDYMTQVPTLGSVSVAPYTLLGEVPEILELAVSVSDPQDVATVTYVLDLAPAGNDGPEDIVLPVNSAPFSGDLVLSNVSTKPNQLATLYVQYYSSTSTPGPEFAIPVWIFNHRGDTNADGAVDQADLDGYAGMVGLTSSNLGYIPFFDTDLDGLITEADACAVGYNWGS